MCGIAAAKQGIIARRSGKNRRAALSSAGDRVLLRTDINKEFDGSPEWMARAPYLSDEVIAWCRDHGVSIVGFDFYHGAKASWRQIPRAARRVNCTSSTS